MIIVSDTTSISNLIQIGELELLKQLYKEVIIPKEVYEELLVLTDLGFPIEDKLRAGWIITREVKSHQLIKKFQQELDKGEAEAIALAIELKADYLLIDEKVGREVARKNQIAIVGTIGVLIEGKKMGLVESIKGKMDELKKIGFWISESLYNKVIEIEKRM